MRILLVCESFTGGCKRHIIDILNATEGKCDATLAYSDTREPGCEKDLYRISGLTTTRVRMLRRPAPLSDFIAVIKLFRIIVLGRFDIVHLHSSKAGFLGRVAAAAARRFGTRPQLLYTPHGLSFQVGGARGRLYLAGEKLTAGLTHRFIAVSEGEKRLIIENGLASDEEITVIPNGIDCRDYGIPADEMEPPVVGMMGRLTEQKGAVHFVEAATLAARTHPKIRFLMAGGGPQQSHLRRRAAAEQCKIEFIGHCSPADFLSKVSIIAIPSLWEGLPYVLLEAMAAGRAIVASDIPGISDTLADCGVLVPPADPAALAREIIRLAEDPGRRKRLGEKARKRATDHFSRDRFSGRILTLYADLRQGTGTVLSARGG